MPDDSILRGGAERVLILAKWKDASYYFGEYCKRVQLKPGEDWDEMMHYQNETQRILNLGVEKERHSGMS